jgi:hypothetical protein
MVMKPSRQNRRARRMMIGIGIPSSHRRRPRPMGMVPVFVGHNPVFGDAQQLARCGMVPWPSQGTKAVRKSWRAVRDSDENFTYSIALQNDA